MSIKKVILGIILTLLSVIGSGDSPWLTERAEGQYTPRYPHAQGEVNIPMDTGISHFTKDSEGNLALASE